MAAKKKASKKRAARRTAAQPAQPAPTAGGTPLLTAEERAGRIQSMIDEFLRKNSAQIVTRIPPPMIQETPDGGFIMQQRPAIWGVAVARDDGPRAEPTEDPAGSPAGGKRLIFPGS